MRELVLTPRFERAFRRLTAKNPALQSQIEATLQRMAENLADSRLKTHRLSGQLAGLHACLVLMIAGLFSPNKSILKLAWKLCCSSTSARTRKFIDR